MAEQDGKVDVVLADPREHGAGGDGVKGDLESRIFEFFKKDGDLASSSEAYMADLATHGVPDTACRRTLIGESVLQRMPEVLGRAGLQKRYIDEGHEFKFGNAGVIRTEKSVVIPVKLGNKQLAIKAAVLPGSGAGTPLLMSKELLRGLKANLDMENDVLVVRRCGVELKLKETERGHYAVPLFEGMGVMESSTATELKREKTQEVNAAETFGSQRPKIETPALPVEDHELHGERHRHEPECSGLCGDTFDRRVAAGCPATAGDGGATGVVSSDSGSDVRSRKRRARRARAKLKRKDDLQRGQVPEGGQSGELRNSLPTGQAICGMGSEVHQSGVCRSRKDKSPNHVAVPVVCGAERPAQVAASGQRHRSNSDNDAGELAAQGKGQGEGVDHDAAGYIKGKAHGAECGGSQRVDLDGRECGSSTVDDGGTSPSTLAAADREPESRAGALERGGRARVEDDEECELRRMSSGEKKLCRRGVESCKVPAKRVPEVPAGTDVLFLEAGAELSISTAAGLTTDVIFPEGCLTAKSMSSAETVSVAIQKVRQCQPMLLVIRTPNHMTRTRGDRGMCRTFTTRQRCAFTRLVAVLCGEQSCEGRQFCVRGENESLKSGVRVWSKVLSDHGCMQMKIGDEETGARIVTNSKEVMDRSGKGWPHVHRRDDERWFGRDIAVAVIERKRARCEVMVAHCVYTIDDLRVNGDESERKIMNVLRKCHENLGHPSPARLVMLLKSAHASDRVIKLARGLECETCSAVSKPKSHNVAKLRKATEFNQQVGVDTFELEVRNLKMHFLNIVDEATGFQLCTPLWKGMQAKHVRNAYRKTWKRWAGSPVRLFSDGGKQFEGEFEHGLSLDGTFGDVSAAYSPWQNGMVERKGDVWKTAFTKAHLEVQPRTKQEVQELVDQINNAVNSMSRVEGFSPFQHVFGRDIRVPGMISSDYDPVINSSLVQGESVFERRMELRKSARRAFCDADSEMKIRKALEHRSRPERGPFELGQLVFFWRKSRFEAKAHWHGPAVVIGKSGQSKLWIAKGTKVYRCSPVQVRSLSPEQEATVRLLPADMVYVRDSVSARGAGNYYDLSMLDGPPDDQAEGDRMQEIVQESQRAEQAAHGLLEEAESVADVAPSDSVPMSVEPPQVSGSSAERVARQEDPRMPEAGDESPSKRQRTSNMAVSQLGQAMRANLEMLDHGRASSSSASPLPVAENIPVPDDQDEELEVTMASGNDHWVLDHQRSRLVRMNVDERCNAWLPLSVDMPVNPEDVESVCQSIRYGRRGHKSVVEHEWKDQAGLDVQRGGRWTGRTVFQLKHGWRWKRDVDSDCLEVACAKRGRKELIEREIGAERRVGLESAKVKEWNKLLQSGAIIVHKGKEAERLRRSVPRKRILKSRFVLTEEDAGASPLTSDIKARWCIRGYLDPDLLELDTSAPTLSAEGFSIAMQLMATHGWLLTIADVEGAFLRGDDLSPSRGRLFVDPPPGGLEGCDESCLVEAVKTVYGLADAPKAWWLCLDSKLRGLGLRPSAFDPCIYYYYHNRQIAGVIALHVDDLCMGGNKQFQQQVQDKLRDMFPFKHWKTKKGEFLGKWLEQQEDGSIKISQEHYARDLKSIHVNQERRRQKGESITESERQDMRAALGGVNWLVSSSRPDLAAWCSLLQQKVTSACVSDLIDVNKLLSLARDYSRSYIWVKPIPIADMQFCVLTDAAWANAAGYCSQAGYMIAGCDSRLPDGKWGTFSILRWKSFKQDRQTHSTLGAELLALSRGLAEARWVRSMWCEAVNFDYSLKEDNAWSNQLPITAAIDCKPVYDHAHSSTVSLKDKRMAIEMLLLKQDIRKYSISLCWMATSQMIVDVLTKRGAPMNLFRRVLREGSFILVEDEAVKLMTSKKS